MAFASPQLEAVFARPIAHRGLHDAAAGVIENTRSAFAAALKPCILNTLRDDSDGFIATKSGSGKIREG